MGESFGDLNGDGVPERERLRPDGDENPFAVGAYDTGNKLRAIRNYGMNFPTSGGDPEPGKQLMINSLNFSDMGYDVTGPRRCQVHATARSGARRTSASGSCSLTSTTTTSRSDDEDLQARVRTASCRRRAARGTGVGSSSYYDAMLLMPANPSMLEARDAILAADLMRFGGANQRSSGSASPRSGLRRRTRPARTRTANTDTDPTPSFESPLPTTR